jgi:nucleoside triphosphate pyrophosphatase
VPEPERVVLASRSPQRRAILEQLGVPFDVCPADVVEEDAGPPQAVASRNALRKAAAVAADRPDEVVLGVDTLVATGLEIWGKPPTAAAARETLARLGGRRHDVVSGLALVRGDEVRAATAVTEVTFRPLDDAMIGWYLATGEWRGRAGGYAIQGRGAALVTAIAGDYLNVVGLPVAALVDLWPGVLRLGR